MAKGVINYDKLLSNWKALNDKLMGITEEQAHTLLGLEISGKHRVTFMLRIHARYNVLRAERERKKLLEVANG